MGRIYYKGDTANLYMEIQGRRQVHAVFPKKSEGHFPGIYKLKLNDSFYIGMSLDIRQRIRKHIQALERALVNNDTRNPFQKGMFQFLIDNPNFFLIEVKIIELCSENIRERERYWVSKYKSDKMLNTYLC